MTNTQYDYQFDAAFERAVLDVLNRPDAFACVPEETLRRIRKAMHDNNIGLRYGVSFPREESDEDAEHRMIDRVDDMQVVRDEIRTGRFA